MRLCQYDANMNLQLNLCHEALGWGHSQNKGIGPVAESGGPML
jgi:hypothetical protein